MLAGDLSRDLLGNPAPPIFDPATGRVVDGAIVRDPFPGNIIPPSRIDPVAAEYARHQYPAPNRPGQIFNFVNLLPERLNTDQFTTRVDHKFSNKTNLFGRFSLSNLKVQYPGFLPTFTPVLENAFRNATLNLVHIFTPTTIFDFKWGYNRNSLPIGSESFKLVQALKAKGLQGIPDKFRQYDFPVGLHIHGFSDAGSFALITGPQDNLQFLPNLSLIRGKHTLAFGADIKREVIFHDGIGAYWSFDNVPTSDPQNISETGQALASFLLGLPSGASRGVGDGSLHARHTLWHFYAQDDVKLTRNLTVNLGLRYEYSPWFTPIEGRLSGFDTTVPGGRFIWASRNPITGEPANAPPTLIDSIKTNFAPHFGIAYLLTPKTTLRAGYGIFYNSNFGWETSSGRGGWPYAFPEARYALNAQYPKEPLQQVETVFADIIDPSKVPPDVQHTMSRRQRVGYMQQWNLHVQRELGQGLLLEVGYVGTKGTRLSAFLNSNDAPPGPGPVQPRRPYPKLSPFAENQSNGNSHYHGLTMKLEKRLSSNLSLLANYAFSKSLDQGSAFSAGAQPQNKLDFRAELGYSDFHSFHIFSMGYVVELPFGPGKRYLNGLRGVPARLVGGWQISGITALRSGRPFNITLNFDNANTGQVEPFSLRPNLVGEAYPKGFRSTPAQWFNTAAFAVPPPYTFGNLGRNALLGPGFQSWDFGLFKNIPIREGVRLQFRSEFFNAFNNVNFGNPAGVLGNSDFGQISYTVSPQRQIQFGLKLIF
jgi:TonB-dependent receptor-like protein